ncbi:MAG TPA: type VI secretion protein [Gammaproteobacteria bacterium]|nr:type VI secretion protein [Gammaproteobacteria bacterium]
MLITKIQWLGIILLLLLLGCSKSIVQTKLITFDVNLNANNNSPIALDVVILYDEALVEQLISLSAKQWYEKREQFKRDYPAILHTWEWEVVPGQVIPFFKIPENTKKAKGALIFANYHSPGLHRARIDPYQGVIVRLLEYEFVVQPLVRK